MLWIMLMTVVLMIGSVVSTTAKSVYGFQVLERFVH